MSKIWRLEQWAWRNPASIAQINDGDIFDRCFMQQNSPHTVIMEGKKNLIFRNRCNLFNVEIDPTWKLEGNHQRTQKDLCYWNNCEFDESGELVDNPMNLPIEPVVCRHVDSTDQYIIDGASVTIYNRSNKAIT